MTVWGGQRAGWVGLDSVVGLGWGGSVVRGLEVIPAPDWDPARTTKI